MGFAWFRAMKFSELANVYDKISKARNDAARVSLLVDTLQKAKGETLAAVAHFTFGELVPPELNGHLGIGLGAIRRQIAALAHKDVSEIDNEVRETGDMSEVAAEYANGKDKLAVEELWKLLQTAIIKDKGRESMLNYIFENTTAAGSSTLLEWQ
jgi:hypothetical protein